MPPLFTPFKQNFLPYIELMFQRIAVLSDSICQVIDSFLAEMFVFNTSGIEFYVTKNNPKTLNFLIRSLKAYYKDKPDVDPYGMAYSLMPSHAAFCPDVKQQYVNRHCCYADKFAILTNGIDIVCHIVFLDDNFKEAYPEILVEKKSNSPDDTSLLGILLLIQLKITAIPPIQKTTTLT